VKNILCAFVMIGLIASNGLARDDEKNSTSKTKTKEAYMGLSVEMVPSVLRSHLPDALPAGQGLLIMQVAKDSPATKAGLQANDILVSIGDQKLSSPEQLVKTVRDHKPGQTIAVSYLRGGKTSNCNVTLGENPNPMNSENPHVYRFNPDQQFEKFFEENEERNDSGWGSFDEMKLTKTDANHWKAEIAYRNKDGKKETKNFSGTRDEIKKAIQSEKDLPKEEQMHLLRALNLHPPVFEFHFPAFGFMPQEYRQQP
jgi:membrane-associated protease RseP (regulator of RpoE activity)